MGGILENAYAEARRDTKDGKRPKKIESYLENQYIQARTGSAELFTGADSQKVNGLLKSIGRAAGGKTTTQVMGEARRMWSTLPPETIETYKRRSTDTSTPVHDVVTR